MKSRWRIALFMLGLVGWAMLAVQINAMFPQGQLEYFDKTGSNDTLGISMLLMALAGLMVLVVLGAVIETARRDNPRKPAFIAILSLLWVGIAFMGMTAGIGVR